MISKKLTTEEYWNSTYRARFGISPVSVDTYKNYCAKCILKKKTLLVDQSGSILEIGGGGSPWIAFLASAFEAKQFATLDFSSEGNNMLRDYVANNGLNNVDVLEDDFFSSNIARKFDLVYSHGVVEHFVDLPEVLRAHSQFLSQDGRMLTIIPNMTGILGILTRALNREIYNIHVPHDLISFRKGHACAGLRLIESGYLCSNNFGVLSSCVTQESGVKFSLYKLLTRISKASWLFEDKICRLPQTKFFSPYIYAISEKG